MKTKTSTAMTIDDRSDEETLPAINNKELTMEELASVTGGCGGCGGKKKKK